MLTCMNPKKEFYHLNYHITDKYLISKTTCSKRVNPVPEISSTDIFVGEDLEVVYISWDRYYFLAVY